MVTRPRRQLVILEFFNVGPLLQEGFVFENRRGELAQLHVGVRDPLGGRDHLVPTVHLRIGLAKDFQGLMVQRLGLSDHLEHLNRLLYLGLFFLCQSVCHGSVESL